MGIGKFVVTDRTGAIKFTGGGSAGQQGAPGVDGFDYSSEEFLFVPPNVAPSLEVSYTTTGNIDDLNFGNVNLIRMNNATSATIRGLAAGSPGQKVTIVSIGAGNVLFAHQNAGSVAGNRLINTVTSIDTPLLAGKGYATYEYDSTTARWRLVDHDQGGFVTYTVTWTGFVANPAIVDGTLTGAYILRGGAVFIVINVIMGPSTTYGTGFWEFSVPGTVNSTYITVGSGSATDVSAGPTYPLTVSYTSAGASGLFAITVVPAALDSATPFTWANGDLLRLNLELPIN